jgi:ATP synthase protein I
VTPPDWEGKSRKVWGAAKYTAIGLEFGVAVAVGWFLGDRFDARFGSAPWGMIVGTLLGFAAGLRSLIRAGKEAGREDGDGEGQG